MRFAGLREQFPMIVQLFRSVGDKAEYGLLNRSKFRSGKTIAHVANEVYQVMNDLVKT